MKSANQLAALLSCGVLAIDRRAGPLRQQLYLQLREAVVDGRLAAGTALPSTRELAAVLGVARSTVVEAVDQLRAEGYLATQQGAASRVARLDRLLLGARRADRAPAPAQAPELGSARWVNDDPPTAVTLRAFRPGLPDIKAFPAKEWSTHLARRARQPASHDLSYADYCGVPALRAELLQHVAQARFVSAEPAQLLVVPSAQAAFDIAARCTLEAGDVAWVEDPGYPGIRSVLRGHGAHIVALPVDGEGLVPATAGPPPRLVYVTPSHQYPSGVTMSLNRRLALLALAREQGALILEDDYDSEFQYDGLPIASLQGLDRAGCVMYVGTLSKTLAPGLHVAYLIVPRRFAALAHTIAATAGLAVPAHVQLALADFMADGGLRRHVRHMNASYAARMRLLAATLAAHGGPQLQVPAPRGGLQLCVGLTGRTPDTAVVAALRAQGIAALALSTLCHGAPRSGLVLGVGLVALDEIAPAARRLCEVVRALG